MKNPSLLMKTDSYKVSHRIETYPPKATAMESYIEARTGEHIVFAGLQMYIEDNLLTPITQEDINEAELFYGLHGEPFDKEMWQYVLDTYDGYMPVTIKAVREGSVIPNRNVVCKISCDDPKCFSIASFLETRFLGGIWPTSSVATISYDIKQVIKTYMELTSDTPDNILFSLNDFGSRGTKDPKIGMGHLINFLGSDNVEAIWRTNKTYQCEMSGFSIPASEHSVITSWGKENEVECYRNFLDMYLKEGKMCACVSDSYDIMNACEIWGTVLKDQIVNSGGTLVVRPDSGDPVSTPVAVIEKLMSYFGYTTNSKGYKVLPSCIRVIQGDGINKSSINDILSLLKFKGISADNIAFGMGGALLDGAIRDTFGWAMKCSAIKVDGEWRDVFKEAPNKNSKKGRLELIKNADGSFKTFKVEDLIWGDDRIEGERMLEIAYQLQWNNKPWYRQQTLEEIRENSNK